MYTAIANARMRRHVTQYKHKVQPLGWTNDPVPRIRGTGNGFASSRSKTRKLRAQEIRTIFG